MSRKRFQFRLQPVLDLRDADERRAREQLATTLQVRAQGRELLQAAESLVAEAEAAERAAAARPTPVAMLAAQQAWRERLERHRQAAGRQLEQAEREVQLSRGELVVAHQRRAVLDKLKETQQQRHAADAQRAEAAATDEIALSTHARRGRA